MDSNTTIIGTPHIKHDCGLKTEFCSNMAVRQYKVPKKRGEEDVPPFWACIACLAIIRRHSGIRLKQL